jgi:hypothetical protein
MKRYIERIWNAGEFELIDRFLAPGFVGHDPLVEPRIGKEAVVGQLKMLHGDFKDLEFTIEDLVAEGDKVVARWSAKGRVPPKKDDIILTGITFARFEDGRIAETWLERDASILTRYFFPGRFEELHAQFQREMRRRHR